MQPYRAIFGLPYTAKLYYEKNITLRFPVCYRNS